MHMESYEVFRVVSEHGSATKAAQVLHMTQSTVSRHLQALEEEFGGLLFERSASGLTLTDLGQALYPYTCDLLSCHARAKEELLRLRSRSGGLCVGATLSIGEYVLPRILGQFRKHNPLAEIRMRISNTTEVMDDLLRHRVDIGLVEGMIEPSADFTVAQWTTDELILVCSPEHPFAKRAQIGVAELMEESLLCREEGSGTRQMTERALDNIGILPSLAFVMELGSIQAIKSAIQAGLGIAFLSRLAVLEVCQSGRLVEVAIEEFHIVRPLQIVKRAERYPKIAIKEFLDLVMVHGQQMNVGGFA
ncbi:MAG: LysR family transcriptional regulator [Bacilli bacterium]